MTTNMSAPAPCGPFFPRLVTASVGDVLGRFDGLDDLQITVRCDGVGHEQFGRLRLVRESDAVVRVEGDMNLSIDPAAISRIVLTQQRGLTIADQQRLDFVTAGNITAFSLLDLTEDGRLAIRAHDLVGGAALDAPLQLFPAGSDAADDPLLRVLEKARLDQHPVEVSLTKPGASAVWNGRIHHLSASRDYMNVIQSDFHLHLRGGRVERWIREDASSGAYVAYRAVDTQGERMELTVRIMEPATNE